MRGYETPNVLPHDLRHQILSPDESAVLSERGNYSPSHVSLPLLGCFKDIYQEEERQIIDICWDNKSSLQPGFWVYILIEALKDYIISQGWDQTRMSEFVNSLFSMLLDIQKDLPNLIFPDIYVINDYVLSRSERQCAITRSQSANV